MNNSKEYILECLRQNSGQRYPMPDLHIKHTHYADQLQQFLDISAGIGGRAELLQEGETIDQAIRRLYPDAERIACNLPEVGIATLDPDKVETPAELNGTDLVVMKGMFGVCENGAFYYEQSYRHRAIYFIAEAMLILLDRHQLVDTMHEAYQRVPVEYESEYRGFISGPSKTADIEQALVKGAHGAKETIVLLT